MIPILAAWKAASPLIKIGSIAGAAVIVVGLYVGWREYQQHLGGEEVRAEHQAELTKQSYDATQEYVRQDDLKQRHVDELIYLNQSLETKLAAAQKELEQYEHKKACPIDADALRIVNDLARVLNTAAPDERVSASGEAAGESSVEAQATVTVTDTAALVRRIAELTEREAITDAAHQKLSEWAIESYESSRRFYLARDAEPPHE